MRPQEDACYLSSLHVGASLYWAGGSSLVVTCHNVPPLFPEGVMGYISSSTPRVEPPRGHSPVVVHFSHQCPVDWRLQECLGCRPGSLRTPLSSCQHSMTVFPGSGSDVLCMYCCPIRLASSGWTDVIFWIDLAGIRLCSTVSKLGIKFRINVLGGSSRHPHLTGQMK